MASSFEKSVKGGTKIKLAPPKSKYVEHILVATHAGEAGVAEIFRTLQNRLRDSTWTIVFKSLIIVHLMIREGEPDVTLSYLSVSPNRKLAINSFTEVQTQGGNIRTYAEYMYQRAVSYSQTKFDYVRGGEGRLKRLTVDKGLLRETENVQDQIRSLLKCEFLSHEPENEITLTAFRLLTMDLLVLFHVMNEGTINVLEHYFEMSRPDATRALNIYKTFVKQTDQVVQYLGIARHYEHATRLEIPKIKHAPTSLAASLEEYLNDKDFEVNRRQYLAQQDAKRNGKSSNGLNKSATDSKPVASKAATGKTLPVVRDAPAALSKPEVKGPAPDLIDFFESIEQNQQPMAQEQHVPQYQQPQPQQQQQQFFPQGIPPQQSGFVQQSMAFQPQQAQPQQQPYSPPFAASTNPFGAPQQAPAQTGLTGAGMGGFSSQAQPFSPQHTTLSPITQGGMSQFPPAQFQPQGFPPAPAEQLQPQSTNPFRQSMMPNPTGHSVMPNATGLPSPHFATSPTTASNNRASTNPFAKSTPAQQPPAMSSSPFSTTSPAQATQHPPFSSQQLMQPTATGTNPFARNPSPTNLQQAPPMPAAPTGLTPTATGSTNPFRQSSFVGTQPGQTWQTGQQGTMGGLEQLPTIQVFPRPPQGTPTTQPGQQQAWVG